MSRDVGLKKNVISASESVSQRRHPEDMVEVHIDIKKLLQFLAGQQVTPTKAVCSKFAFSLPTSSLICIQSSKCKYAQFQELKLPGQSG